MRQLHSSPDVFLVDDFLTPDECDSIVAAARVRDMDQSPVVYAGWTNDVGDIVTNVARGPALWAAALSMLSGASANGPGPGLLVQGVGIYALVVALAVRRAQSTEHRAQREGYRLNILIPHYAVFFFSFLTREWSSHLCRVRVVVTRHSSDSSLVPRRLPPPASPPAFFISPMSCPSSSFVVFATREGAGAGAWVKYREAQLQGMRTSTSCVLRGESVGEKAYVRAAEALMPGSVRESFEAPTVIRYEPGQQLAPHFDANR